MARVSTSRPPEPDATPPRVAPDHSTIRLLLASVRPEQWTKNLLVLAGVVFGGRLLEPRAVAIAAGTFVIFCALSGAIYLFNDVADRDADQNHPLKRERPIASGRLSATTALLAGLVLGVAGVQAAFVIGTELGLIAGTYLTLLLIYSAALKHVVIVDVLVIAAGFVLRAIAGAVAVRVPIGHWLLVCTTLLALFIALSKRRHELTSSTLIAYTVYATSPDTATRLGTTKLGLTIPFVLYGIFRYLYLVHQKRGGGSPSALLLTDRPLLACVALWAASVIVLLYSPLGK
jgi:4-hydroxybenzoate polyprenyltransferase